MRAKVLPEDGDATTRVAAGDVVEATLVSLTPKTLRWNDKQTGAPQTADIWEWEFQAVGSKAWIKGSTPAGIRGKNKTRTWCEALVGELPDGFEFDTDSLISLSCRVKVKSGKPYTSRKTGRTVVPLEVEELYSEGAQF